MTGRFGAICKCAEPGAAETHAGTACCFLIEEAQLRPPEPAGICTHIPVTVPDPNAALGTRRKDVIRPTRCWSADLCIEAPARVGLALPFRA